MKNLKIIVIIFVIIAIGVIVIINIKKGKEVKQLPEKTLPSNTNMKLLSPAFANEGGIPAKYTCDGDNINPPLTISEVPAETKSLVLIVDDPDAPAGTWIHWLVWNINPETSYIAEGFKDGVQGTSSFGETNYGGPCPPSGEHRYYFKLYALDEAITLSSQAKITQLEERIKGHILAQTQLMGRYHH